MVKSILESALRGIIEKLGYKMPADTFIYISKNPHFGDYTTSIALQLAKQKPGNSDHSPQEIAKQIAKNLGQPEYLSKVEVAGAGFINFFVKKEALAQNLEEILKLSTDFGRSEAGIGKKARVEFVSANPTGPLHIGNARGGPLGDVLCNILAFQGWEVVREYLHNDVGEQVKALGGAIQAVAKGEVEVKQYQGEYVKELAIALKGQLEGKDEEEVGRMAVKLLFEEIMEDVKKMGISFDSVTNESDLRQHADKVIKQLQDQGVIKEKDRALWLAPSDEFLKDRETVVQKSDGGYTYFTADIVYHQQKFESNPDLIIDVFGSNHHGHVPRLQAAMAALGFDVSKLKFILYQYVRVKRGDDVVRMSKRAGTFITAREVLDEVGVDAFRFMMLVNSPQTHIDFDLELVKQKSAQNPVYYVQYAHARMANILKQVREELSPDLALLRSDHETELIKHLLEFPSVLHGAAHSLTVHGLPAYAVTLADLFHKFYEHCRVLNAETEEIKTARIALVKSSQAVLRSTLGLLGVAAPERM